MANRWAFFAYGHNLGDITRAIETAKGMRAAGHEARFYTHGCAFQDSLAIEDLDPKVLLPELTWEQHRVIMDINRYRAPVGTPIPVTEEQWIEMAEADLAAFAEYKPDGVYAGLNLSCMISVPYAKLPMVTLVPTVNCPAFIERGMYDMPNTMERNFVTRRLIPRWVKRRIMRSVLMGDVAGPSLVTFNAARKKFGLPPITNIVDLVRGDLTLLPDLPELSGLPAAALTPGYRYTGPIFSRLDLPVPEEAARVFSRPGLKIFLSFGSSGFPEVLAAAAAALRSRSDWNVICATTTVVQPAELGPPSDNFFAAPFMPAHLVAEMADVGVLHGGQGTIQSAVWAGLPLVGIAFQAEQQANIDGAVRAGMAERIPLYDLSPRRLLRAVERVGGAAYKEKARSLRDLVRKSDGVAASVRAMNEFLEGKTRKG